MKNITFTQPQFKDDQLNQLIMSTPDFIEEIGADETLLRARIKEIYTTLRNLNKNEVMNSFSELLQHLTLRLSQEFSGSLRQKEKRNIIEKALLIIVSYDGLFNVGLNIDVLTAIKQQDFTLPILKEVVKRAEFVRHRDESAYQVFIEAAKAPLVNDEDDASPPNSKVEIQQDTTHPGRVIEMTIEATQHLINPEMEYDYREEGEIKESTVDFSVEEDDLGFEPEQTDKVDYEFMEEGEIEEDFSNDYYEKLFMSDLPSDDQLADHICKAKANLLEFIRSVQSKKFEKSMKSKIDIRIHTAFGRINKITDESKSNKLNELYQLFLIDEGKFWLELKAFMADITDHNADHHLRFIYKKFNAALNLEASYSGSMQKQLEVLYQRTLSKLSRQCESEIEALQAFSTILQNAVYLVFYGMRNATSSNNYLLESLLTSLLKHPSLFYYGSGKVNVWRNETNKSHIVLYPTNFNLPNHYFALLLNNVREAFSQCEDNSSFIQFLFAENDKNHCALSQLVHNSERFMMFWNLIKSTVPDIISFKKLLFSPFSTATQKTVIQDVMLMNSLPSIKFIIEELREFNITPDELDQFLYPFDSFVKLPILTYACAQGDSQTVNQLLQLAGTVYGRKSHAFRAFLDVASGEHARSALMFAANNSHTDIVNLLIEAGAKVPPLDKWFRRALEKVYQTPGFDMLIQKIEEATSTKVKEKLTRDTVLINKRLTIALQPIKNNEQDVVINFRSYPGVTIITNSIKEIYRRKITLERTDFLRLLSEFHDAQVREYGVEGNKIFSALLQHLVYFILHRREGCKNLYDLEMVRIPLEVIVNHPLFLYVHNSKPTIGIDPLELNTVLMNCMVEHFPHDLRTRVIETCQTVFDSCHDREGLINLINMRNKYDLTFVIYSAMYSNYENFVLSLALVRHAYGDDTNAFAKYFLNDCKSAFNRLGFRYITNRSSTEMGLKLEYILDELKKITDNPYERFQFLYLEEETYHIPLLYNSVRLNNPEFMERLLHRAADLLEKTSSLFQKFIDERTQDGFTALMRACSDNQIEMAKTLIKFGANPLLECQKYSRNSVDTVKNKGKEWDFLRDRARELRNTNRAALTHSGHFKEGKRESSKSAEISNAKRLRNN